MNKSASASIENAVQRSLEKYFPTNPHFIIGVSGGPDSMALMYVLSKLEAKATIVHINYGLRDAESDLDQELVEGMSFEWGFECISLRVDSGAAEGQNFQNWARKERYRIFEELADEHDAAAVIVAHHQDDQVETILQKLFRGSGVPAWQGMKIWDGKLYRPLLSFSKQEILDYCNAESIPYRIDQTNEEAVYARNFIRKEMEEGLDQFFPGWKENILSLSEQATVTDQALRVILDESSDEKGLIRSRLHKLPAALRKALFKYYLESEGVEGMTKGLINELEEVADLETGKHVEVSPGFQLVSDRDHLSLIRKNIEPVSQTCSREQLQKGIAAGFITLNQVSEAGADDELVMDANSMEFPVTIRHWASGDRIRPLGMEGTQTVADHLTNRKVSAARKGNALVLCGADATIYAILFPKETEREQIGTISESVKCTDETSDYLIAKRIH